MVQLSKKEDGSCIFFDNGLCQIHDNGLKPTKGILSLHSNEPKPSKKHVSLVVAQSWLNPANTKIIFKICEELISHSNKQTDDNATK